MKQSLPPFSSSFTSDIPDILTELGCTIAVTTYQAGKVIFISANKDGIIQLARNFNTPMGITHSGRRMGIVTKGEVVVLADDPNFAMNYPKQPDTYDAFIGENDGVINYYKNTGSSTSPTFTAQTGANNPFNGVDVGSASFPAFADIDGDTSDVEDDAFIGEKDGTINYYNNTATYSTTPAPTLDEWGMIILLAMTMGGLAYNYRKNRNEPVGLAG